MCGQKEIKMENKKYFELNENENTTCQNAWRAAEATERTVQTPARTRKEGRSQIGHLRFQAKDWEKKST